MRNPDETPSPPLARGAGPDRREKLSAVLFALVFGLASAVIWWLTGVGDQEKRFANWLGLAIFFQSLVLLEALLNPYPSRLPSIQSPLRLIMAGTVAALASWLSFNGLLMLLKLFDGLGPWSYGLMVIVSFFILPVLWSLLIWHVFAPGKGDEGRMKKEG